MQCSIISEPLAGLENQALGLAEAAGLAPILCRISPRGPWGRLPARAWPRPLARVSGLEALGAGMAISVGGTSGVIGAALRRRDGRVVVQVQNPRIDPARFDLVVAARHDELAGRNVVVTRTALHRVTPARLAEARTAWAGRFAPAGARLAAVLGGGPNGRFRLGEAEGRALATQLRDMMQRDGVAVAVTPSRRTPRVVVDLLREALVPLGAYVWDGADENPYFGLVATADLIVVTGDSVSMVSEAVASAAPVLVAPLPGRSRRIGLFLEGLLRDGRIRLFDGRAVDYDARPLDDTGEAAQEMRLRLGF